MVIVIGKDEAKKRRSIEERKAKRRRGNEFSKLAKIAGKIFPESPITFRPPETIEIKPEETCIYPLRSLIELNTNKYDEKNPSRSLIELETEENYKKVLELAKIYELVTDRDWTLEVDKL